jgi:hypothetical protein
MKTVLLLHLEVVIKGHGGVEVKGIIFEAVQVFLMSLLLE